MKFTAYQIEKKAADYRDLGELINVLFYNELSSFYEMEKTYKDSFITISQKTIECFDSFSKAYSSISNSSSQFSIYLSGSFGAIIGLKNDDYLNPKLFSVSDETGCRFPYIIKPNLNTFYELLKSSTIIIRANQLFFNFIEDEMEPNTKMLNTDKDLFDRRNGEWIDINDIDSKYEDARLSFNSAFNFVNGGYLKFVQKFKVNHPHYLESYLNFGKYKKQNAPHLCQDLKLSEIINVDLKYVEWLIVNINHFFLEKDQIDNFKDKISKKAFLVNARKVNEYSAYMDDYNDSPAYNNSDFDSDSAERDYFYTMTDGNYGSYEEFYGLE
jgi:hypothetical protein